MNHSEFGEGELPESDQEIITSLIIGDVTIYSSFESVSFSDVSIIWTMTNLYECWCFSMLSGLSTDFSMIEDERRIVLSSFGDFNKLKLIFSDGTESSVTFEEKEFSKALFDSIREMVDYIDVLYPSISSGGLLLRALPFLRFKKSWL